VRELRMLGSVGGGLAVRPWFSLNGHLAGNGGNGQGSTYRLTVSSLSRHQAAQQRRLTENRAARCRLCDPMDAVPMESLSNAETLGLQ